MNALAKIDGVMPWVSASARSELESARYDLAELIEAMRKVQNCAVLGQRYHATGPGYTEEIQQIADLALARFGAAA